MEPVRLCTFVRMRTCDSCMSGNASYRLALVLKWFGRLLFPSAGSSQGMRTLADGAGGQASVCFPVGSIFGSFLRLQTEMKTE